MAQCIKINVKINGQTTVDYPILAGQTASQILADKDFCDVFNVPDNVEPVINGVCGDGPLSDGDTLEVKTKASAKA